MDQFAGYGVLHGSDVEGCRSPVGSFLVGAGLSGFRGVLIFMGTFLCSFIRRRLMYLGTAMFFTIGLYMLATFLYFNQDGQLTRDYWMAKYVPLLCLLLIYAAYGLGYSHIPYILQGLM